MTISFLGKIAAISEHQAVRVIGRHGKVTKIGEAGPYGCEDEEDAWILESR